MARTKGLIDRRRAAFLAALAKGGTVSKAAAAARIPLRTAYNWRDADEAFGKAWDDAIEAGTDLLEDEAVRRATAGVKRPVYQGGKRVGYVQDRSDTLLIFMLKGRRPEKFKDRAQVDVELTTGLGARMEAAAKRVKT